MIKFHNNKSPKEQTMKIVFVTSTLVALLVAIGIFDINNNSILENTFAQKGKSEILSLIESHGNASTMVTSSSTTNQSQPTSISSTSISMNWAGTIEAVPTIEEAFKSKISTDILGAIQAAQASIGANSSIKEAVTMHAHGYLVYTMFAVDENMKIYLVIVDPGNGQIIWKEEIPLFHYDPFKLKITTDILGAIQAAQASIGANSSIKDAVLIPAYGLAYKIFLIDENMKQYNVIVDPRNGQVLSKEEVPYWYDDHEYGFGNH